MKYLLLTRARKNFGDFLIFNRGLSLIKQLKPNCNIIIGDAGISLDKQFSPSELYAVDAIVIPGGPGIRTDSYPNTYPLSEKIFSKEIPIYFLGAGSKIYPYNNSKSEMNYSFSEKTKELFNYMCKFSSIGVRDHLTLRLLTNIGLDATVNGCPAWYSLSHLNEDFLMPSEITQIVFSVPAGNQFVISFLNIIRKFRAELPEVRFVISFNHGLKSENIFEQNKTKYILDQTNRMGCEALDMSGSGENTLAYDQSSIHIGYRVHSHIYFLSTGKPSFLVAEDSRGIGAIETLGIYTGFLNQLTEFNSLNTKLLLGLSNLFRLGKEESVNKRLNLEKNAYKIPEISNMIYDLFNLEVKNDFSSFRLTHKIIRHYYEMSMKPYIESL